MVSRSGWEPARRSVVVPSAAKKSEMKLSGRMPKGAGAEEIGVGSEVVAAAAAPPPETWARAVRVPSGRPGATVTRTAMPREIE